MPPDRIRAIKEEREALRIRVQTAAENLDGFVTRLRAEVDTGTEATMMSDEQRPETTADTLAGIAAIKAEDRLADEAQTAKTKLDGQALIAADLLLRQAEHLAESVNGLRDAVANLEQRTIITEERHSLSTERASLTEKQLGGSWNQVTLLLIVSQLVLSIAIIVLYYMQTR